jgi:pimeloyl-ACP methyl ester carboxylesterase
MCDQTHWELVVRPLSSRYGVVTVDLAGHGLSGRNREQWTLVSLAEDLRTVVEKLGLRQVVIAGHSMGGTVALETARLLPGTMIGIIGVDTLHDADQEWDPEEMAQLVAAFKEDYQGTCNPFVRSMFVQGTAPEIVEPIVSGMCSRSGEAGIALLQDLIDYDMAAGMRAAGVPIRCVNADFWPTDVAANQQYCDFDAAILVGYGHFLMQEAPEELAIEIMEAVSDIVGEEN